MRGVTTGAVADDITVADLENEPYGHLATLREHAPVAWLPALGGWMVTRRDLCIQVMRDAETFTVDDPRFTTAAVLGPSMLSLDGAEHLRHRTPFAPAFRPAALRESFDDFVEVEAGRLVEALVPGGRAEFRTSLAGPLAVRSIARFLGLVDVESAEVLGWYEAIRDAIMAKTLGRPVAAESSTAVAGMRQRIEKTLTAHESPSVLRAIASKGQLVDDEVVTEAVVIMFGAIETAEGMTTNALWHLLSNPEALARVRADRSLIARAIEESLRLEPAAAVIDRYATCDIEIDGARISAGDLVTVSLLAANRDPEVFEQPDRYDLDRGNSRQHVTFVQGPHGCLGLHLARMETAAAISAVLDHCPDLALDSQRSTAPHGLIFRKADAVIATWSTGATPQPNAESTEWQSER